MTVSWLAVPLALALATYQTNPTGTAADAITLRDGSVLLGQVAGSGPFGVVNVVARRAWVEENLPAQTRRWEGVEAARVREARLSRRVRLIDWRRDRAADPEPGDPLPGWIGQEIGRVSDQRPPRNPLMLIELQRVDVRGVARRDDETARWLRLAWRRGLADPERLPAADLGEVLRGLGALERDDPAPIDDLLPLGPETEATWRARRGATEAVAEPGLRYVQFRDLVLPEEGPGPDVEPPETTTDLLDTPAAVTAFGAIQAIKPADPLQTRLDDAADRGRVGVIYSRVEFQADSDEAQAESTLWVRVPGRGDDPDAQDRWSAVATRRATVRVDEPADPSGPIAAFTPVRTAVLILESVASTPSQPELSDRRQVLGAAAQRALGRARVALADDLARLLLPVPGLTAPRPAPNATGRRGSPRPASPGGSPRPTASAGRTAG
jgi:hypothetical protein